MRQRDTDKRIRRCSAALICLALAAPGTLPMARETATASSTLDEVRRAGVLVAGISRNMPPFARQGPGGKPSGFDVDLIDGLARDLGVQVVYVPLSGASRITAVQAGSVHLTAGTLTATPQRRRLVDFSSTYFHDAWRILVRSDSAITGPEDLAGLKVGVAPGPAGRDLLRRVPTVIPVSLADNHAALSALMNGRIQAVAAQVSVLEELLGRLPDADRFHLVGEPFSGEDYALALPKGDGPWQQQVNSYLSRMEAEGRREAMVRKWFGGRAPLSSSRDLRPQMGSGQ